MGSLETNTGLDRTAARGEWLSPLQLRMRRIAVAPTGR
jgi:hypothetical protein